MKLLMSLDLPRLPRAVCVNLGVNGLHDLGSTGSMGWRRHDVGKIPQTGLHRSECYTDEVK
jgi:hypothetical protein